MLISSQAATQLTLPQGSSNTSTNLLPQGNHFLRRLIQFHYSGFTKNMTQSNVIAHDITDVRSSKQVYNNTLLNNGAEIFNSGGYSNSSK